MKVQTDKFKTKPNNFAYQ